jgi:polysaccharide export outer membrane protein
MTMKPMSVLKTLALAAVAGVALSPAAWAQSSRTAPAPAPVPTRVAATAPAPAPARAITTARSWTEQEYRLGPGDKLRVEIYREPQLSQSLQVRPDGKITLPLIGDLEATNRTPIELRDQITKSLREFITNPVVTVIVQEALSAQVYITGEVSKSGPVQIVGPLNILQAIAMAGGLNEFANKKDVRILRQGAAGLETIRFNYQDALNGDIRPIYLKAGDTIVVK